MAGELSLRIDMTDVAALARRCDGVAGVVSRESHRAMTRVVVEGEGRAKRGVSRDTSHYARSITHAVNAVPGGVIGRVGSNVPYAPSREFGRRAGAPMPPAGSLLPWLRRHGIAPELEYVVRRAIGRRGIKGEFVFRDTLADIRPLAEREFAGIAGAVARYLHGGRA